MLKFFSTALTSLYTSIVEPHFRYCCSVWGCAGTTEINRLQKLQNRAARIVTNRSLNELAPSYLRSLFRKDSQSTSYRQRNTSTDLRLPKHGTENRKKSFSLRGAQLWSILSANCKQAASLSTFKHHIYLLNERCSFNSYLVFMFLLF